MVFANWKNKRKFDQFAQSFKKIVADHGLFISIDKEFKWMLDSEQDLAWYFACHSSGLSTANHSPQTYHEALEAQDSKTRKSFGDAEIYAETLALESLTWRLPSAEALRNVLQRAHLYVDEVDQIYDPEVPQIVNSAVFVSISRYLDRGHFITSDPEECVQTDNLGQVRILETEASIVKNVVVVTDLTTALEQIGGLKMMMAIALSPPPPRR